MNMYEQDQNGNFVIRIGQPTSMPPPQQQRLQQQIDEVRYDKDIIKRQMEEELEQKKVQTRQMEAICRIQESQLLLNGMNEIRSALVMHTVGEGDVGSTVGESRPPLKQVFDDEHAAILQKNYVSLSRQFVSFTEHIEQERFGDKQD